ncbi:EscV/YscV/HrcV family type III secretion system export apparatus protein [Citrobacter amalonaticus]|uniref:EscV/YscV/HrcV family type III secretion system export apparatus protein n=2 Tax=Citrobacter amalonaticus TaxID=35703 RepID=A0A2S4S4F4_CITAM|nr:EscV/YscV/HrcV family type III secretion system export apparatus protein [Citrobacter amalonaticus]POT78336.1 EscV/YscV/HrcV family type III secretion system export apparatus protein [Citrobacter amalonaticus]POU68726.1 EscV/YscV/HrcV family type III secretion system export apparatus protein [Citrobacter amalonaticus]POV08330.1 EscV/YscV/HrcV family type III secretion system export apparatus protein [Citrobacter amalonaticus]
MLNKLSQRPELFLVILMVVILAMLIIPLPTWLIDILLAVNISISILLFIGTFYIQRVLEFSALPSVLLITTLFRLALSISTSRMILIQADAGHIINTFGNFVIAGDIIVGLIIFSIITLFQFIVITKGSERVAEVCARFSLDAMPGKQMSIDADLRAGTIAPEEAQQRRSILEKESQLFGALDGTMKFIKGDAIAGIVIIFVNFLGGISIGMGRLGMSFSDATDIYTILTIGDALVAQIPALLISIGTGFVITRVSEDGKNLGNNIIEQIFSRDFVLLVTGVITLLMGMLPGFPLTVFFTLSLLFFGLYGYRAYKRKAEQQLAAGNTSFMAPFSRSQGEEDGSDSEFLELDNVLPETLPILILVPQEIFNEKKVKSLTGMLKRDFYVNFGIQLPDIRINAMAGDRSDGVNLLINEVLASEFAIAFGYSKILQWNSAIEMMDVDIKVFTSSNIQSHWVKNEDLPKLQALNLMTRTAENELSLCVQSIISQNIAEFFGIQETKNILDKMEALYPELLKETYRHATVQRVAEVFQRLLKEKISVRNMKVVLEALALWAGKERDTILLVEHVRGALARYISDKFAVNNHLSVLLLSPETESRIRKGIRNTSTGSFINLDPEDNEYVMNAFNQGIQSINYPLKEIVVLAAVDIRRYARRLLDAQYPELEVLSFGEISDSVKINVVKTL